MFFLDQRVRVLASPSDQALCIQEINRYRARHIDTPPLRLARVSWLELVHNNLIFFEKFTKETVQRGYEIITNIENKQDISRGKGDIGENFFWYYGKWPKCLQHFLNLSTCRSVSA